MARRTTTAHATQKGYDVLILGASGMQGRIAARDLLERGYRVFLADLYKEGSESILSRFPLATFAYVDLRKRGETQDVIRASGAPVVLNCAEGDWNLDVYHDCLVTRRHVLDLGSDIPMTREQLDLSPRFEAIDRVAITGCGSTPGINNVMLHYAAKSYRSIRKVDVGFAWDANMKEFVVPFSMESIIEEFTELAPVIEKGRWVNRRPLANVVEKRFRGIGRQLCFPVRHPETLTFSLYHKKNGLRDLTFYAGFPKHSADVILSFIKLGFGSKEPVSYQGTNVVPVDILGRVLGRLPRPKGYAEVENLWVTVTGESLRGRELVTKMECLVPTLPGWEDAGCNIDTGMPASIMTQMVLDGRIGARGSFPPGAVTPPEQFFRELAHRAMSVYRNGRLVNAPVKRPKDVARSGRR